MDQSSDRTISEAKGPIDYVVAFGHHIKVHRINSKDKFNKGLQELMNTITNEKRKNASKLPRVIKTCTMTNADKRCDQTFGRISRSDTSGTGAANSKPSQIPRLKITPNISREDENVQSSNKYFKNESNIQRVYLPNLNPDFCQDERPAMTSLASTRPIPTLGRIYSPTFYEDLYNDWYMELDVPREQEPDPHPRITTIRQSSHDDNTAENFNNEVKMSSNETIKSLDSFIGTQKYKTTNDNIKDWLSNEMEYPTKDNESGYSSLSPCNQCQFPIDPKHFESLTANTMIKHSTIPPKTSEKLEEIELKTASEAILNMVKEPALIEQQTVVINRIPEEKPNEEETLKSGSYSTKSVKAPEPVVITRSECSKNLQFPSATNPDAKQEKKANSKSYIECASEILQKTTNFEVDGKTLSNCDSPKTTSSMAETDIEPRHDYSSQFHLDDRSLLEEQPSIWSHRHCASQSYITITKSDRSDATTVDDSLHCVCHGRRIDSAENIQSYHKHDWCQMRQPASLQGDATADYKRHSRYRRFPSYRYKLTHPFSTLRKRFSNIGICRRRWNYVWKRTAARWNRRPQSHLKLNKYQIIQYLERGTIWKDVDVQTPTPVFQETGIHTTTLEKKSTGVCACVNLSHAETGSSSRSFRSRVKHINLGPSRFPFFYNSTQTSLPLNSLTGSMKIAEKQSTNSSFENRHKIIYDVNYAKRVSAHPDNNVSSTIETIDTITSPMELHGMKTVEIDTGTDPVLYHVNDKCVSNISSESVRKLPEAIKREEIATQMVVTFNNIETDISFTPFFKYSDMGLPINPLSFYKPIGINTDSLKLEPEMTKRSAQMMTSTAEVIKPETSSGKSHRIKQLNKFKSSWPKRWSMRSKKKKTIAPSPTLLSNQPTQLLPVQKTTDNKKEDLSVETTPPCLVLTRAKILSISSSQLVEASAVTSNSDMKSSDTPKPALMHDQSNNAESFTYHCYSHGSTLPESKSKEAVEKISRNETAEQNIGSKEIVDEISQGTSTTSSAPVHKIIQSELKMPSLIDEWCQKTETENEGTKQKTMEQKSADVYAITEKKSVETDMTHAASKETQSDFSVKNDRNDENPKNSAFASTYTSLHLQNKSIGQSTPEVLKDRQNSPSIIDTWVQYSQITNDSMNDKLSEKQYLRTRIGHSKLMSARVLNESMCDHCTQIRPSYYDTETDAMAPRKTSQQKSVAIMTWDPTGNTPDRDPTGNTPDRARSKERYNSLMCGCAYVDTETNTLSNFKITHNMESYTRSNNKLDLETVEKATSNCSYEKECPLSKTTPATVENIQSLSRLIGQAEPSLQDGLTRTINSSILSSKLNADKWIKRCTKEEKDYQSIIDVEESALRALKRASLSIAHASKHSRSQKSSKSNAISKASVVCNLSKVVTPSPEGILSNDSLADVLPINDSVKYQMERIPPMVKSRRMVDKFTSDEAISEILKESETEEPELPPSPVDIPLGGIIAKVQEMDSYIINKPKDTLMETSKMMIDTVTSGEIMSKELKESILQTCPDIKEASIATDIEDDKIKEQKSVSVYTSKCVLPKPKICSQNDDSYNECLFVYDKPHCVVHKTNIDASVQSTNSECIQEICPKVPELRVGRQKGVNHTIDLYSRVGEVLSPKVYEALYETTKTAVKDRHIYPVRDTGRELVNTKELDVPSKKSLAIRSAAMVTSQCGLRPSKCHCHQEISKEPGKAEYVFAYDTPQSSLVDTTDNVDCHAKVLDIPTYCETDFIEERVKTELVGSCRYYSNLLTKRLGLAKGKDAKRRIPTTEQCMYLSTIQKPISYTEACTMKPSGREDLGCQTHKEHRTPSCCDLSPSLMTICKDNEKHHLNSIYFMLSAIDGRIRRLKRNVPD